MSRDFRAVCRVCEFSWKCLYYGSCLANSLQAVSGVLVWMWTSGLFLKQNVKSLKCFRCFRCFTQVWVDVAHCFRVSSVSAGTVNYSIVDFSWRRNWRACRMEITFDGANVFSIIRWLWNSGLSHKLSEPAGFLSIISAFSQLQFRELKYNCMWQGTSLVTIWVPSSMLCCPQ